MSEEPAGKTPAMSQATVQAQSDTQRLRAVEGRLAIVEADVHSLKAKVSDSSRVMSLLRTMVESILTAQAGIRDDLGVVKASIEGMPQLLQAVDTIGEKLDRLHEVKNA